MNVRNYNFEASEIQALDTEQFIPRENNGYLPIPLEEEDFIDESRRVQIVCELTEKEMEQPARNVARNG